MDILESMNKQEGQTADQHAGQPLLVERWWHRPLLLKEQMTAEELAKPYNPYYIPIDGSLSTQMLPINLLHNMSEPRGSTHTSERAELPSEAGNIQQRRAYISPEKFNHGQFEPLQVNTHAERPSLAPGHVTQSTGLTAGLEGLDMEWFHADFLAWEPPFSMLESLCDKHDVLLHFVSFLTLPEILSLYSISKRFHYLWNANYVAHIRASMRTWAPTAEHIFPWSCYKSLCIKDPWERQKSSWVGKEDMIQLPHDDKRDVPSLRWLQMVVYREGVSLDILIQLALKGLRCMPKTSDAVKRMWFLLDLPLNAHRIALMRSQTYMNNKTLLQMTGFMLKIDMFLTEPFGQPYSFTHTNHRLHDPAWAGTTFTGIEMREYLLAERGLTPLWRVLRGWSPDASDPQVPMTRLDVLRLWARHKYQFPEDMLAPMKKMSFAGVPWYEIGTARLERVGQPKHEPGVISNATIASIAPLRPRAGMENISLPILTAPPTPHQPETLLRPDELVMLEAIRRRLKMHEQWLSLVAFGLHDGVGRQLPLYNEEELNRAVLGKPVLARAKP